MGGHRNLAACAAYALLLTAVVSAYPATAPAGSQQSTTLTTMAQQVAEYNVNPSSQQSVVPAPAVSRPLGTAQFQAQQTQAPAPAASTQQTTYAEAAQGSTGPQLPPKPAARSATANGPAPNPQALLNSLGSVVTAASSVANAQQAVTSAAAGGGNGNILQSAGTAAQALEAVQKAAGDVSNAQKTLQSGGQVSMPTPTPTPAAPPALNINIPGLGGNQAPAGVTYTPGTGQYAQAAQSSQTGQTMSAPTSYSSAQSSNAPPSGLGAIGSALAQALASGSNNNAAGRKLI